MNFTLAVLNVVKKIPRGKTLTYKQVAQLAGSPAAARAVGTIMRKNQDPDVPCHRVICSNGKVGGYNRGSQAKKELLEKEGAL